MQVALLYVKPLCGLLKLKLYVEFKSVDSCDTRQQIELFLTYASPVKNLNP